jgi:hypothetical protein
VATQRGNRKTAFRLAIVNAGTTVTDWARENEVSRVHLYAVLNGDRVGSAELNAKIDALIKTARRVA